MIKRLWSPEDLKHVLGEPRWIIPKGSRAISPDGATELYSRTVRAGEKLVPGEKEGAMRWDCFGLEISLEALRGALRELRSSRNPDLKSIAELQDLLMQNFEIYGHFCCSAVKLTDAINGWTLVAVCPRHGALEAGDLLAN